MDLQRIIYLVKETKEIITNREMAAHVKEKGVADYVTQVDVAVQNFLKEELYKLYPEIQFLGEESPRFPLQAGAAHPRTGRVKQADFRTGGDPVDGTTNLIHDYHHSVVSLALCQQNEIVLGIVYDPYHDEVFSAVKGEGSFLNGKPIHVSSAKKLSETIIGIGTAKRELAKENFTRFLKVYENSQDIRRLGSAALELAYTACGRQGGYFEVYLNPWDYAAGILLVEEAGGKVTDWIGNKLNPRQGNQVIGTNGNIHQELLRIL